MIWLPWEEIPYEEYPCGDEIQVYFRTVLKKFPNFKGFADPDLDSEVSFCGYSLDMPLASFRLFEEGWTCAVREYFEGLKARHMVVDGTYVGALPMIEASDMATQEPFYLGSLCGEKWVETASRKAIRVAAVRETVNEMINRYFAEGMDKLGDFYQFFERGLWTSEEEIETYIQMLLKIFPEFIGSVDIERGNGIEGMAVDEYRLFEDGWTAAVRREWARMQEA